MESARTSRKIDRKSRKHQYTINKETGVLCSTFPTKILGICNAGQINGLTEEVIIENYLQFGVIDRVLLIPGKSCCFLSYDNIESASKALEATNGKLNIGQNHKPVFLTFIEAFPKISDDKIWNRLPPGLIIVENFVSESEELELLDLCKFDDETGNMKHRQVKHYGYEFRYDINNVDKDKPLAESIPKECDFLWQRLEDMNVTSKKFQPDQLTVNHYKPGQGIPAHVDTHSAFEDPILSLSLGSAVVMEFKRNETIGVLLPRRSLAVIAGESRYDWTHGITPRTFDFYHTESGGHSFKRGTRVSFTFRKVLEGDCHCNFKLNCDSYAKQSRNNKIDNSIAWKIENQHVHEVYEDIAEHFSETRHKPWPNVLEFVNSFQLGDILVDVGCGNGKYLGQNRKIFEVGLDRSFHLNELCKERGFESFTGNCLTVPIRDNTADGVISIAVIHHLVTEERRLQAIAEIVRILRPGGRAIIYVWSKQQVKNQEKSSYIKQDRKQRKAKIEPVCPTKEEVCVAGVNLPVHVNRTDFNHSDLLVPWKLKGDDKKPQTFLRFYHVFEEGELDGLCERISGVSVVRSFYDQGNCCVILEKFK